MYLLFIKKILKDNGKFLISFRKIIPKLYTKLALEKSKRSFFSRNPFYRNKVPGDTLETGSLQSDSTTASFLAPVNIGDQVRFN